MTIMSTIRFINKVSIFSGRLGSLIVLPLVVSMVYEVISRYFFSTPTAWAFELSYMMMGSIFMFGISYALYTNTHVNVDFIHDILPRRLIGFIDFICYLVLTGLNIWISVTLLKYFFAGYASGEGTGLSAWNPPVWPFRLIFLIGFTFFTIQTFGKAIENAAKMLNIEIGNNQL